MSRFIRATLAAGVVAVSPLALSGCAAGTGGVPTPTVTTTVTSTVTATPAPSTASPDDPLDAQTAWTACAVLAQEVYGNQNPQEEMRPYDPAHPPTQREDDGTWQAYVFYPLQPPVEGAGSMVVVCQLDGTLGSPKLVKWLMKDV